MSRKKMGSSKAKLFIIGILLYMLSTGVSYAIFSMVSPQATIITAPPPTKTKDGGVAFDQSLPKTESCPLNGAMYSKQQRTWWEKHRPLGVMIENHEEARPQSGLSTADVVYEAIAEGGITRFLTVFYCQDGGIVGPVRSARTYFLDFISEYGDYPLYAHVGGANTPGPADALSQIEEYGWQAYNDMNQFSIGYPTFWRDYERLGHEVATEHTMYSKTDLLWIYAKKRELTNIDKDGNAWDQNFTSYTFKEDVASSDRPISQAINIPYWEDYSDYDVDWVYDKASNTYLRSNGGEKHIDKNTNKQIAAKNVVVLFMRERNANDGYENNAHLLYGTKGTGQAQIFMDGVEIKGTWSKKDRESRTILKDSKGNEVEFNKGKMWFHILPLESKLTVK